MRILLINPPHPSIGSRLPREHLPPLGLLAIGGPLIDKGHEVKLLDAMRWYTSIGRRVWFHELFQFFFRDKQGHTDVKLSEFWTSGDLQAERTLRTRDIPDDASEAAAFSG